MERLRGSGKRARLLADALFVVGFGFLWCAGFLDRPSIPESFAPIDLTFRFGSGLIVIVLGILSRLSGKFRTCSGWIYATTILFALTCAVSASSPPHTFAYAFFDRIVYGVLFFYWMAMSFRRHDARDDAAIPLGFLLGSLLNLLYLSGVPLAFASNRISCIAISFAALVAYAYMTGSRDKGAVDEVRPTTVQLRMPAFAMRYATLVLGAVAFAFVFGAITDLHGWMDSSDGYRSAQTANVCAAAIACIAFLAYRKPFKPDVAISIILPVFAAALISTPSETDSLPFSRLAIMTGYLVYWAIAWVFVVREYDQLHVGGLTVLALVSGSMLIFAQIGRMAASIVLQSGYVDPSLLTSFALMLFWLLVLFAIGAYWTSRNKAVERDLAQLAMFDEKPSSPASRDDADSSEKAACEPFPLESAGDEADMRIIEEPSVIFIDKLSLQSKALSRRIGLSVRETEVMEEFIRGRSAVSIAEKLFVSRNTVKTHLRRIYEKAGIHSRQELLDMLEAEGLAIEAVRARPQD